MAHLVAPADGCSHLDFDGPLCHLREDRFQHPLRAVTLRTMQLDQARTHEGTSAFPEHALDCRGIELPLFPQPLFSRIMFHPATRSSIVPTSFPRNRLESARMSSAHPAPQGFMSAACSCSSSPAMLWCKSAIQLLSLLREHPWSLLGSAAGIVRSPIVNVLALLPHCYLAFVTLTAIFISSCSRDCPLRRVRTGHIPYASSSLRGAPPKGTAS